MEYNWLFDNIDGLKEKIRFKDKTIYKISGKLHNITGPAIIYHSYDNMTVAENSEEYWINGNQYSKEEWNKYLRIFKIKKIKNKINI